jgi:hypothetical protein
MDTDEGVFMCQVQNSIILLIYYPHVNTIVFALCLLLSLGLSHDHSLPALFYFCPSSLVFICFLTFHPCLSSCIK